MGKLLRHRGHRRRDADRPDVRGAHPDRQRDEAAVERGARLYSTPTVVHFGAALLVTVLLSAPWPDLWEASIPLGCLGLAGLAYGVVVLRRATIAARSETYRPVLEDWLCHAILPPIAYAVLLVAAFVLPRHPTPALFAVGAVVILFILLGIHNAWDIVTYITVEHGPAGEEHSKE